MTRREFLLGAAAGCGAVVSRELMPLPIPSAGRRSLKMAVFADLHHGLAPDAMDRLQAFCTEVRKRKGLQLVAQLGDYNYSQADSAECVKLFEGLPQPKLHVLGNHDMDKCTKQEAMALWGMDRRYGSRDFGDYRFVHLDLNHFKKDGKLVAYEKGNYFTDNATHNWADLEQLEWLERELLSSKRPVVLMSHQPLGFAQPGKPLPAEQAEVLDIVSKARAKNPRGAAVLALCGHMHLDRLERVDGMPCYCVNSASYLWAGGMVPYTKPLFAFMELTSDGNLVVEAVEGAFVKPPPASTDGIVGVSPSISARKVALPGPVAR